EIASVLPVQLLPFAVRPRAGLAMRMIAKREQRRDVAIRAQPDIAAAATVTAVGSALGNVRFAAERHTTRAAVTAFDIGLRGVDEAGHDCPGYERSRPYPPFMRLLGSIRTAAGAAIALALIASCSSGHGSSSSTTTTPSTSTSSPS